MVALSVIKYGKLKLEMESKRNIHPLLLASLSYTVFFHEEGLFLITSELPTIIKEICENAMTQGTIFCFLLNQGINPSCVKEV